MKTCIIGIDCASDPKKRGIAIAQYANGSCDVTRVVTGLTDILLAEAVSECLHQSDRVLLALDAPLGWPKSLGSSLAEHHAGNPISALPNNLFRRDTDRFVKENIGKQSLDVGADRIARTAYSALVFLEKCRKETGQKIPLAWEPSFSGIAAIEVYPAATLKAHKLDHAQYKDKNDQAVRLKILDGLRKVITIYKPDIEIAWANADALDAIVCILAGLDFLSSEAYNPKEFGLTETACKEGWIWVKPIA